ncbi:MAG: hypothetical protein HY862_10755 [Chloroflexi bacterium]|nr:hypothetical protein [Chloroflexota bacterium]
MSQLPVRQMVLYKHGVGFFMREGRISGQDVTLTFRHDEINDVLKSLAVFDRTGGQILGIHYQTPMDVLDRLANSSINLSDMGSLRDLLRDLRGRQAIFTIEITPGSRETHRGRIIGLDDMGQTFRAETDSKAASPVISMLTNDGQARFFKLSDLHAVQIQDDLATHDLTYFLDTAMSEDSRRSVALRLSEGEHQLVVNYVAPSPTWRVSYRIVAETNPDDKTLETGKALLQGWGLFDNRLEEDLEDVQVTLVAGQPISFIYDLYASRIPERPIVEDESRIAPGPIEFAAAKARAIDGIVAAAPPAPAYSGEQDAHYSSQRAIPAPTGMAAAGGAMQAVAEGSEKGEFFQYVVTAPVSVKRGESALVPIISAEVSYQRELLYNPAKFAKHPVAALRFKNSTGLTLERGPVTIVEDEDYKGEAVVAFTKDSNDVYLPYAIELGVNIKDEVSHVRELGGLSIKEAYLVVEEYQLRTTLTTIENTTAKSLTITIEANKLTNYTLYDTHQPNAETLNERRWRVSVEANGNAEFARKERSLVRRQEEIRKLNYQRLRGIMENRTIEEALLGVLGDIAVELARQESSTAEEAKINAEREDIYRRQEHLRANLQTLQPVGQEATLRNRLLNQLEASEDRLQAIAERIAELKQIKTDAENKINQILADAGK